MVLEACGFGASASVTCIAEAVKASGRSNIRAGGTEWRKQEALLCMNSWKIDGIPGSRWRSRDPLTTNS